MIYIILIIVALVILFLIWRYSFYFGLSNKRCQSKALCLTQFVTLCFRLSHSFCPPPERAAYLDAKYSGNVDDPAQLDNLRKLLMRRAISSIPVALSLQNEGNSIERLYKRGMLTDDMHYRVG